MRDDHDELMARLRAADPVPDPLEAPTFDALLGDADPDPAPARGPSRGGAWRDRLPRLLPGAAGPAPAGVLARRRPQVAFAAFAALLAVVVIALSSIGGGSARLDAVASARAALAPSGEVVHMVLSGGLVTPDGSPVATTVSGDDGRPLGQLARRREIWGTALPLRFLVRQEVVDAEGKRVATSDSGHDDDGVSWQDNSWQPAVHVQQHAPLDDDAVNSTGDFGVDPARTVRQLLDDGTLRDQGTTTVDGRPALRFGGDVRSNSVDPKARQPGFRLEYLVDPKTFAPLELRSSRNTNEPTGPNQFVLQLVLNVESYERLPLDASTRALFRPPTRP